jgi:hypothetical protein
MKTNDIDKNLAKDACVDGLKQSRKMIDSMEKIFGKESLYRLLFEYPKKWSRRKVKKKGKKDMEYVRLDIGVKMALSCVANLGENYKDFLDKTSEETDDNRSR